MPLKPLQPNSLNINQHIKNVMKDLGITDPHEQMTIEREIGNQLMQLAMNQSSSWVSLMLSPQILGPALRTMVEKQHALYMHANKPAGAAFEYTPMHTEEMKEGIKKLKEDTLKLIADKKNDLNLDTAFRKNYLPKLEMRVNNLNPNDEQKGTLQATKELKFLLDLHMLLKHGSKTQLENFVDKPDDPSFTKPFSTVVIDSFKRTPEDEEKVREEKFNPAKLIPPDRDLVKSIYGQDPQNPGSEQQTLLVIDSMFPITVFAMVESIQNTSIKDEAIEEKNETYKSTMTPFKTTPEPPK